LADCISLEHIERGAQSAEEAMREIDSAIAFFEQGIQIAPDAPWPPIEFPIRLALGQAYRLKGQAYLLGAQPALANAWFVKSLEQFEITETAFAEDDQKQYLAWTHLGRAATYQLQGYTTFAQISPQDDEATVRRKQQETATLFQQASEECEQCLEVGRDVADLVYQRKVLRCGCEYVQKLAQAAHAEVQKLIEEQ
jgi:hypothetical protein